MMVSLHRVVSVVVAVAILAMLGVVAASGGAVEAVDEQPFVTEEWTNCTIDNSDAGCEDDGPCWTWGTWVCDQGRLIVSTEAYPDGYCFIGVPEFDYCKQG